MATSIVKFTKSFFVKLLVGIIILPFVFWGMGDVFRGGNQNVIATIDSDKVSTQEFVKYLNRLNLNNEQIKNLKKTNLMEKILSDYIGKKVMSLEIKRLGISVNDNSLRNIIINDKLFLKDNKFSRTAYEKFLLESNVTAPTFEKNIVEQESKRQFLSYLAGGITIPEVLINKAFNDENQIKTIKYIDLENYYLNQKPSQEKIKKVYEKNKDFFIEEFKSMSYAEITPLILTGNEDYSEDFFKKLDNLENKILDGQLFEDAVKNNNLKSNSIIGVNKNKKNKDNKLISELPDDLFKTIYNFKNEKTPKIFKIKNKFFLAEVKSIESKNKSIKNPDVIKFINNRLSIQSKLENNASLIQEIKMGGFNKVKMENFAKENNLIINEYKILNMKQNEIFSENIIKRIFFTKDNKINLVSNNSLTKNFLIFVVKTKYKKIEKNSSLFEQYEAKARLELVNRIYRTFDQNLNQKYKVELNKRTIDRVKNSF